MSDSSIPAGRSSPSGPLNPYAPPVVAADIVEVSAGSFPLGFVLGFSAGLGGLIGCLAFARAATKKGAGYGFLARLGLVAVTVLVMLASS